MTEHSKINCGSQPIMFYGHRARGANRKSVCRDHYRACTSSIMTSAHTRSRDVRRTNRDALGVQRAVY